MPIKATPQNRALGALSDTLRSVRATGDRVQIPVLGGLGSLFLGKSPEEVEEWSYGNAPMQMTPQGVRLPQMKRGRGAQFADTAFAAVDLPALRALTAAAGRPLARALENSPLYDAARTIQEARSPASHVVKPKGGNWLTGSVEDALKGLKKEGFTREQLVAMRDARLGRQTNGLNAYGEPLEDVDLIQELRTRPEYRNLPPHYAQQAMLSTPQSSLNSWIEGPLTKYVKTRMASPDDEVRKLAEEGVLHFDPSALGQGTSDILLGNAVASRARAGFPIRGEARTPLGEGWENMADAAAGHSPAATRLKFGSFREKNPWLEKLDPDTPTYHFSNPTGDLGFNHLIDELSNALNPNSGLPRHLQLTPEAMKQMSMEKAVRRVDEINKWRGEQIARARLASMEGRPVIREYAENNPKGLRWVELNRKGDFAAESDAMGHSVRGYEPPEGGGSSSYGLGGWDAIQSGKAKVYSLQDAKGEPHVTVEVGPGNIRNHPDVDFNAAMGRARETGVAIDKAIAEMYPDVKVLPRITQIKGKQNKAPNPEYLPFVQDFVRNNPLGGQWADVGDLGNTGLLRNKLHPSGFINRSELEVAAKNPPEGFAPEDFVWPERYAQGGPVKQTPSWDILGL